MRKLLMAIGNQSIKTSTIDFATYLARMTASKLTGLIYDDPYEEDSNDRTRKTVNAGYQRLANHFEHACENRDTIGLVKRLGTPSMDAILLQARYADLLMLDQGFSSSEAMVNSYPTHDVKKLLHEAECPVLIGPERFSDIKEVVLAYDGSESAVYAIKQFTYLFPEFCRIKLIVVEINEGKKDLSDERNCLNDWLQHYFDQIEFILLEGDATDRLLEYLLERTESFLVIGGYGRGRFSRLLHPSSAAPLVRMISGPIFITHP